MLRRTPTSTLHQLLAWYPVVVVTGPRQSGKTTLTRASLPGRPYVNLESATERAMWESDPEGSLRQLPDGAILDEFQRLPGLASWLQVEVDRDPRPGRWILTGSENLAVTAAVSQSLAGRAGHLTLLPPSLAELRGFPNAPTNLWEVLFGGAYPRILDRGIPPSVWLADYVSTYLSRDVRDVLRVGDLGAFMGFLRLCAGRTGQEVNLSALGGDAGITPPTARAWLTALEAMWVCFRLPRWAVNATSQVVKAPKLHFFDTGLACYLLGVREPDQLATHPLRGALFESWVAAEIYKQRAHRGLAPGLSHFRDSKGPEVDLVLAEGAGALLMEAKSGETPNPAFLRPLERIGRKYGGPASLVVVYGGRTTHRTPTGTLLSWADLDTAPELAPFLAPAWTPGSS